MDPGQARLSLSETIIFFRLASLVVLTKEQSGVVKIKTFPENLLAKTQKSNS